MHEHGGTRGMIRQGGVRQGCVLSPRGLLAWRPNAETKTYSHIVPTSAITCSVYWTHASQSQHPAELYHLAGYLWRFWNETVRTSVWAV